MTSEKTSGLTTPIAILLGSAIISLGLYLGLRSKSSDAPPALPPKETSSTKPPSPAPRPPPVADKTKVSKDAVAELYKHRKSLTEKCAAASFAKKADPPKVKYLFNITFDAQGKIIARGVIEDRATSRPDVSTCVNDNFPDIRVPPPGQTVLVDVPLELP